MRRDASLHTLRSIAVLLLLGVIINLLVAWGCVILAPPPVRMPATVPLVQSKIDPVYRRPGRMITDLYSGGRRRGLTEAYVAYLPSGATALDNRWEHGRFWRAGWPRTAFACVQFDRVGLQGGLWAPNLSANQQASRWPSLPRRALPWMPEWSGFAVNTAMYTTVLAVLFFGYRRWRYPPGCCQSCRYDLRGNVSGVCPECGAKA